MSDVAALVPEEINPRDSLLGYRRSIASSSVRTCGRAAALRRDHPTTVDILVTHIQRKSRAAGVVLFGNHIDDVAA